LISIQHMKFGALSAVLVSCTLMISTIDLSQNFVFAQNTTSITPAPELSGSNEDDSSSSEDNDNNNDENNESTGLSGTDDDDGNSNGGDSEDTTSSEEEDETEDDSEQTNPLLEEIRNRVNGALSATGMPGPGF
jgi:cytoskeletal protein RodZ